MKLYVTPLGRWAGTQKEARALAQTDTSFREENVPSSKPMLLDWLNEHRVCAVAPTFNTPPPDPAPAATPHPELGPDWAEVEEAIWNADPARVLALNEVIGERLRELGQGHDHFKAYAVYTSQWNKLDKSDALDASKYNRTLVYGPPKVTVASLLED